MHYLKRITFSLLLATLASTTHGCVEEQASGLMITDVVDVAPPTCTADSRSTAVISFGRLDVLNIYSNQIVYPEYYLAARLENTLFSEQDLTGLKINEENEDYQAASYRINIIGYTGCLSTKQTDDPYRHCDEISEAVPFYYPIGSAIDPGNPGIAGVSIDVLSVYEDISSIADGDTVVIRIRALGRTENGTEVKSNEFRFPIRITVGQRSCGSFPVDETKTCFSNQDSFDCIDA